MASSILKFAPNIPQTVSLKFPTGRHVNGHYGEQVMYSLESGSIMYVPIIVEKKLAELAVKKGQPVEICKAQENGKTEWQVSRAEDGHPNKKPQGVVQILNSSPSLDELWKEGEDKPGTRLEHALRTALYAAKEAEKYSVEIGHPVQFDKDDIRLMAQTLVINGGRERAA